MKAFAMKEQGAALEKIEVDRPQPSGREVLLKVTHAGVCHTDTHVQEGGYDLGSRGTLDMSTRGVTYPCVMGHETVGEVVEVGSEVENVSVGDTCLAFPWIGCGQCGKCAHGQENACDNGRALGIIQFGGFADYLLVPDERYAIDVAGVDPAWAATLACSGVTSYSSARKATATVNPDEPIGVMGVGGVGMMTVAALVALGHKNIIAIDVSDENLASAQELGATVTVNSKNATSQDLVEAAGGQFIAIIDLVNTGDTVALAFDALSRAGKIVQVGLFGGEFVDPTAIMALKGLTLQGNYVGTVEEVREVVELARQGSLPKLPITGGTLNVVGVNDGLERLRTGRARGRTVLTPSAT